MVGFATSVRFGSAALTLTIVLGISAVSRAEDWPVYRGPRYDGISTEKGWLDRWPAQGPTIAWKATVGLGHSSMVTKDGRLFTAGHADEKDTVYCLDAETGQQIWSHSYPADLGAKFYDGGTTGTPTAEGDRVYWLGKWGDLFAFEAATGRIIWNVQVQKATGIRVPDWGFTGAPRVHGDLLILNVGEAGVAVKKDTGEIAWKSADKNAGYSTPLPIEQDGRARFVIGSGQAYIAVDPETGAEAWRIRWLTQYGVNAADPIVMGNKVFLSTGYNRGAGLFDVSQNPPAEIWKSRVVRTMMSPGVLYEGHVYAMDGNTDDRGALKCVEFSSGAEKWAAPAFGTGGLVIADGRIIAVTAHGELVVAPATPEGFKPTARAQVLGGTIWTAPVLSNGRVYCRNSAGDLVCVDLRNKG
jgi:outer membrane protein assembly factor BamB